LYRIEVPKHSVQGLAAVLGSKQVARFDAKLKTAASMLSRHRLVNVTGDDRRKGGVYEIIRNALPYLRGAGINVIWLNLSTLPEARPALEFFHVLAHGRPPADNWRTSLPQRTEELRQFGRTAADELAEILKPDDVVVLHDTQTAPLATDLSRWQKSLIWHAHIGTADRNEVVGEYWKVIGPSVTNAAVRVFYRPEFAPSSLRSGSVFATPGLDPSTPKSQLMDRTEARHKLISPPQRWPLRWLSGGSPAFGSGHVVGLQISRWDPLKDMGGALRVFTRAAELNPSFCGLVVGPSAESASEKVVLAACFAEWETAPASVRSRVHVGVIEQCGTNEHDLVVRVLQSAADIVLQKSVQEGFGLTVTEAMLRAKSIIASEVGGIPLQVRHGSNGVLVHPGASDEIWVNEVLALVEDEDSMVRLGASARADVLSKHTIVNYLTTVIDGVSMKFAHSLSCLAVPILRE
jgi:trehalose synthase